MFFVQGTVLRGRVGVCPQEDITEVFFTEFSYYFQVSALKPFKLPSFCPSIQLDISYLATFIIH